METYILEKWKWTDADFETMGWHDATVYSMRLDNNLSLDIDYIFKWNEPEAEGFQFTFFVAPCTLVFNEVKDFSFDITMSIYQTMQVEDIERTITDNRQHYTIITREANFSFTAAGYSQTVRMCPSFQLHQQMAYDERGGISLEATIDNKLSIDVQERVNARRTKEFEHYTWAKERHLLKRELEALVKRRDANDVDFKDFIKEKNRMRDKLAYYNMILQDSHYEIE